MKNNTQKSSVLILGAKGMLGGQFLKIFGARAIGWDREECDITDLESLKGKILRLKPGVVFLVFKRRRDSVKHNLAVVINHD